MPRQTGEFYALRNTQEASAMGQELNALLARLSTRLDKLEGLNGTPTFYSSVDMSRQRIRNIADPSLPRDVQIKELALSTERGSGSYNAGGLRIVDVGAGVSDTDVVNVSQLNDATDDISALRNVSFVVMANTGFLNAERALTGEATVITIADGGPNSSVTVQVTANGITNAKLRQGVATSVIGRSVNSTGNVADIAASADKDVLWRNGTTLAFAQLAAAQLSDGTTGSGAIVLASSPTIATPTITTSETCPLVIGGTGVGSTLSLRSTSGVGATDAIIFQVGNNGATEAMRIITSGKVGIATTTPSFDLGFGGNSQRTLGMERHTTADTAGNQLVVSGGSATSGATNKAAGTLSLSSGISTGSGISKVQALVYGITAGATSDNTQIRSWLCQGFSEGGVDRSATLIDGMLLLNNQLTAYNSDTSVGTSARIYGSNSTGGSYPFTTAGNLIVQSRPAVSRDVVIVTGSTPATLAVFTGGGKIGLFGTTSPTNDLSFDGTAARKLWMERHSTADTAGNTLTIQAGGATSGATDKVGGPLLLLPGQGTGNSIPGKATVQTYAQSPTTGTTNQALIDRACFNEHVALTNNSATTVVSLTCANGSSASAILFYTLENKDASSPAEVQVETGEVFITVNNKNGTVTATCTELNSQQICSTGTLASTWAASAANPSVVSVNNNSSLTNTTGYPRLTCAILNLGNQAISMA